MTASRIIKGLLAGTATVALIGTAIAQGNPPNPAKSAPVGAGQQSSQGTPMGTTGTPGGSTATGSTATGSGGSTNMGTASSGTTSGTTSGSSMGSTSTSADTSSGTTRPVRTAKADRN